MEATLTGVKLFSAKGYVAVRPLEVPLETEKHCLSFTWRNVWHREQKPHDGKEARNVSEAERFSCVAGYCTGNDSPPGTCSMRPAGKDDWQDAG